MKLVVGYLATPGGADAVALAVRLARTLGAELELCIVLQPDRAATARLSIGDFNDLLAEQAKEWLNEAAVAGRRRRAQPCEFRRFVRRRSAQGSRTARGGRGRGRRLRRRAGGPLSLGSVVNELLHSSPVPVAVAPRGTRHSDVERVREVTCAIGEREGADLLLRTAVRFSKAAGTPLRLASLVPLDPTYGQLRGDPEAVRERALEHARHTLETAKDALPESIPVTSTVVDGPTVEDAVSKLDWRDGDLIMVGSSRLSAPKRLFLGSTAAKMLRVLDVPMMVVPRDQLDGDALP